MRTLSLVLGLAVAAVAAGCDVLDGTDETEVTLYVGPMTVTCFGPFERQCLLVKETPDALYELFYDHIQGFTFELNLSGAADEARTAFVEKRDPEFKK